MLRMTRFEIIAPARQLRIHGADRLQTPSADRLADGQQSLVNGAKVFVQQGVKAAGPWLGGSRSSEFLDQRPALVEREPPAWPAR